MSHLVTVSRKLVKGAPISIRLHRITDTEGDHEVGASLSLDEFLASVVHDIGNPTLILTKAQLTKRLTQAATRVVAAMKAETSQIV